MRAPAPLAFSPLSRRPHVPRTLGVSSRCTMPSRFIGDLKRVGPVWSIQARKGVEAVRAALGEGVGAARMVAARLGSMGHQVTGAFTSARVSAELTDASRKRVARTAPLGGSWRPLSLPELPQLTLGELGRTHATCRVDATYSGANTSPLRRVSLCAVGAGRQKPEESLNGSLVCAALASLPPSLHSPPPLSLSLPLIAARSAGRPTLARHA